MPNAAQVPLAKLSIGSLDEPTLGVTAQYNPKELQRTKSVKWAEHESRMNLSAFEFTGIGGRTLDIELLFDTAEVLVPTLEQDPDIRVPRTRLSIEPMVATLERLAAIRNDSRHAKPEERRPHHCVVVWGEQGVPKFACVIESVTTKYTMFHRDGVPIRATCTVKLREAHLLGDKKQLKRDLEEIRRRK